VCPRLVADREIEKPVRPYSSRPAARPVPHASATSSSTPERFAVEPVRARATGGRARFDVREVEQPVTREVGVQHDGVHAARVERFGGPPRDRCRIELAAAHDAQLAAALRHEHLAARQERKTPRTLEPARVDGNADVLALRRVIHDRLVPQRRHDDAGRRDRRAVVHRHLLLRRRRQRNVE
jgi:hypothetical protein